MPRPCTIRLLLLAASLLALSQAASADVPGRIATQGVLRTDAGSPVSDGKYPMVIKIYDTGQGGEALWTEFHIAVAVAGGFFALDLGSVDAKNPPPMALFATKADLWIGLQVSDNPELPRTKLASVPFAAKALLADSATAAIKADTAAKADTAEALSKPITGDLIAPGSLSASAVGFTYAGSNTKGGPAIDLQCTGCVGLDELDPGVLVGTNVAVGGPLKGSSAAHVYAALSELFDLYAVLTGTLQVKPGQLGVGKAPADGCALDVAGATCEAGAPVLHSRVVPSQQDLEAITTVGLYAWRTDTNRPYVRHPLGWRELVMKPLCGDGVQEGGEACDDGKNNANAPDACRPTCVKPSCGDKVADTGEACDDGNGDNTDACLATCKLASCGDGHVYAGVEECDDGNGDYTDACVKDCKKSKCGDGYVLAGVEDCDLGPDNGKPNGTCTADCKNVNLIPYHKNGIFFVSDKTYAGDFNKNGGFCTKMLGQTAYIVGNNGSPNAITEPGGTWQGNSSTSNAQTNCSLYTSASGSDQGYGVQGGYGACSQLRHVVCSTDPAYCNGYGMSYCPLWD